MGSISRYLMELLGGNGSEDHWGVEFLDQSSHNKQIRNRS